MKRVKVNTIEEACQLISDFYIDKNVKIGRELILIESSRLYNNDLTGFESSTIRIHFNLQNDNGHLQTSGYSYLIEFYTVADCDEDFISSEMEVIKPKIEDRVKNLLITKRREERLKKLLKI